MGSSSSLEDFYQECRNTQFLQRRCWQGSRQAFKFPGDMKYRGTSVCRHDAQRAIIPWVRDSNFDIEMWEIKDKVQSLGQDQKEPQRFFDNQRLGVSRQETIYTIPDH